MMKLLTIGQLAKTSGMAARTIRYYEQVGVMPPAKRTSAGYRQYEQRAVERLLFVRRARALGLPLRHLETLCATLDGRPRRALRPRLLGFVQEQLSAVQQQIGELELLKQQLEQAVDRLLTSPGPGAGEGCRCLEGENGLR
jgi:MerR family transcriptional regulator, copper efflux regulator